MEPGPLEMNVPKNGAKEETPGDGLSTAREESLVSLIRDRRSPTRGIESYNVKVVQGVNKNPLCSSFP